MSPSPFGLRAFWYVVAEAHELGRGKVLGRKVLDEWLAVFRDDEGRAVALRDRCMHRNAPLSKGTVEAGRLRCPYHGWVYDGAGTVVEVPAEGASFSKSVKRCAKRFDVREQDGFVYVRLAENGPADIEPFDMPHWGDAGFHHIRLVNRFRNNVINCAENFIDVPHTVFVHPGIFRKPLRQEVTASIRRAGGSVRVDYRGETSNLGWFRRFLNPSDAPIVHRDNFHMPNVTEVEYVFGPRRKLFIISQCVPEEADATLVYTTLSYDFGAFSQNPLLHAFARRILRFQGQRVIDQDLVALASQMDVLARYGEDFNNTAADAIHVLVESIRDALAEGKDPRDLPERSATVRFYV